MSLLEAGRHIGVYGWSVARTAAPSEQETLKQAAETFIASVQHWTKGGLQAVTETLAKAGSLTEAGSEDHGVVGRSNSGLANHRKRASLPMKSNMNVTQRG